MIPIFEDVFSGPGFGQEFPGDKVLEHQVMGVDEVPGGGLQGAVAVQQFRAEDAALGVFVHECGHFIDGPVEDFAVGIEAVDQLSAGNADGLVVGFGEPGVLFIFDDDDVGEFFPDGVNGTVFGIIIGDDNFKFGVFGLVVHRLDAGDGEMFFVGVDDGDG